MGDEFIIKAEAVKKIAQHGIIMRRKTLVRAKGVGNPTKRLAKICGKHRLIGDIVGHFA
jgi:hypothetical protein